MLNLVRNTHLIARHPKAIRADKYLLPVLHESDYPYLAKWLRAQYDIDENDIPLDAALLAGKMGLKILQCAFPVCSSSEK